MTEPLDISAQPVDGCFFLRNRTSIPADFSGTSAGAYQHVYTYWNSARTIRSELEAMIAGAKRKIFIASFLLGDAALLDLLAAAASRLMGGVYVITQLDEHRLAQGLQEIADSDDPGAESGGLDAAIQAQKKRFDQMTRNGIYVRGHLNCHAKFVVADDETAMVTSANLMTSALDFTGENGVVITDRTQVRRLARLFARLWHTGCEYEARPGQEYRLSKLKQAGTWTADVPAPATSPAAGVIWTDGAEHHILAAIQDIVASAQSELLLASFGLTRLREHRELLLDPIRAAVTRGVRVRLLIRPRRDRPRHLAEATELAKSGVEIYGDRRTHVKAAIADGRHGALFSANFDFEHGLTSGVEVGCRLDDTLALGDAARYLRHAIDQANLVYAVRPTHRDLDERLDAEWRVPWPLGKHLYVTAAREEQIALARAAAGSPALFTIRSADELELHIGSRQWRLTRHEPNRYQLTKSPSGGGSDSQTMLTRWLAAPAANPRRGICATLIEWADDATSSTPDTRAPR
jgi:phosphatidylserine/phosphatidylglycerophosphate/cardiolipin synthase-like enzyme